MEKMSNHIVRVLAVIRKGQSGNERSDKASWMEVESRRAQCRVEGESMTAGGYKVPTIGQWS